MRKYIIVVLVLVAVGVGVAFMLIPDEQQVAGARQQDQALIDVGNVDIEAEYAQGRRSFPIISALADKRIAEGNRPAAVKLLEEYVTANPTDVHGRKKLAEQYLMGGDDAKYNEQLEAIASAEPTEENLKILSYVYAGAGLYEKQIETLRKIVDITQKKKPEHMADLATVLAINGHRDEAVTIVREIRQMHPNYRSYAVTRIEASALTMEGKGDEAYALAEGWMKGDVAAPNTNSVAPSSKELADLTNILNYGGFPEHGVKLVEPHLNLIATEPELAVAYVNANINAGHSDRAFQVLTDLYNTGKMSAALYKPYLDLALQRDDLTTAETIVTNLQPEIFTEEEAINLIELPTVQNNPDIATKLAIAFDKPEYLANKPVLAAVVAMGRKAADQDAKISAALKADLSSTMRVRLAQACYRAKKDSCIDEVLKGFPAVAQMNRIQVDEYADLHIAVDRAPLVVDAVGAEVTAGKKEIEPAYIRLAAASGKTEVIDQWLLANGATADIPTLQRLYFIAADHKQPDTAIRFAVKLFERDPSPMNRDILIGAYLAGGDYARALPLVRENLGKTANASEQYLSVLGKLAKTDEEARKEMIQYASSVLSTSEDDKSQLAAAYTLLNNGQRETALPYIKQNAETKGGEWAIIWKQLNPPAVKNGGAAMAPKNLTPAQMVAIANNPKSSEATKRQMAFGLIAQNHKAEAAAIFQSLAATRGPDDQNVKDLLYLWGPKLNSQQVAWLAQRAKASKTSYEQAKWADYVNTYGDDNAIVQFVSASPDALYNRDLRRKYFNALASYNSAEVYDSNMRGWVAGTSDVDALRDYAETAQNHGYKDASLNAYKRISAIAPNDEKTLVALGTTSFGKGNYTASKQYLDRYDQVVQTKQAPETDPQEAYFYRAQLLRRQNNIPAANAEFQKVVAASQGAQSPAAQSRLYTSLFHLGQHEQGKQGFRALLQQYPDDKGLLADYMGILIEYKYLDEATAIANQYDKTSPNYRGGAMLLNSRNISGVESFSNGREMKITFNQPIEGKAPISEKEYAWLEETRAGYDSMVVSAKPGYLVRFSPTAENTMQVVPVAAPQYVQQEQFDRDQELRLQLLYAQIEQQNGQTEAAQKRLAILQQYYPNNPQLLTYSASIQSAAGNRDEAMALLNQARSISPENEEIANIITNMNSLRSNNVYASNNFIKGDYEFRGYGRNNEHIFSLSGAARVSNDVEVGFDVKHDDYDLFQIQRGSDGRIGNWQGDAQQGELYAAWLLDQGARAQASLFANNDTAGAGLYYDWDNTLGRTGVFGEYHRPYWDTVEGVYNEATRDRVGARHFAQINPTLSLGVEGSLNRYNTAVDEDVAQSGLFRLSLIQRLQAKGDGVPYLAVGYGFDGEYMIGDNTTRVSPVTGQQYKLLPQTAREVHVLTGIVQHDFTPSTHAQLIGGYAFDRLGESGPIVEGRLTQDITDNLEAGVRARYGLVATSDFDDNEATGVGAHLMYKF